MEDNKTWASGVPAQMVAVSLAALVFALMTLVLRGHVPMAGDQISWIIASASALPVATVFWMATQMFMVTLADQMQLRPVRAKSDQQ